MSAAVIERAAKRSNKNVVPPSPPGLSAAESAFNEGRDMVIAMITKGQAIANDASDSSTKPDRWARIGRAQNRFCEAYLQRLIDKPDCLHGFAAALSAFMASDGGVPPPPTAFVEPMAEYLEGKPGADGTKDYPEDMGEDELLELERHFRQLRERAEAGAAQEEAGPELQPEYEADFGCKVENCDAILDGLEGLAQLFDGRFSKELTYTKLTGAIGLFDKNGLYEMRAALGRFTDMCESLTNEIPVDGPRYTYSIDCLCGKAVQHAQEAKGIMAQVVDLFVNAEEEQPLEVVSPAALCNVLDVVLCCLDQVRDNLHEAKKLHG